MNKVKKLENIKVYSEIFKKDKNNRSINIYKIENVKPVGSNLYYPNCMLKSEGIIYNPINERIMSLMNLDKTEIKIEEFETNKFEDDPLFFFIYNTDNYYHFVYDTLPYLISFLKIKKEIKEIKLLMNYPNSNNKYFYKFVNEFLDILGIKSDEIKIVDKNTNYRNIYISSSYTHGDDSNLPPRKEIYEFYKRMSSIVLNNNKMETPKNIYVSRRTWINKDLSNIGTNYTTRRRLNIEDELVDLLKSKGYAEVFTESLTTIEKIIMFQQAENIIGSIGGGLCNVLFSSEKTNLIAIVSPTFLDINKRFEYSFNNVNTLYFNETRHIELDKWKKYMRVSFNDIVGEIEEIHKNKLLISYVDENVAGWNSSMKFNKILVNKNDCKPLDDGLNSHWTFDIEKIIKLIDDNNNK